MHSDAIIYNLGVGAKTLNFLYEKDKNFQVIPTYSTTLKVKGTKTGTFPFTVELLFGGKRHSTPFDDSDDT